MSPQKHSSPPKKWSGFEPVEYFLDEKAFALPVQLVHDVGGKEDVTNITIRELLSRFKGKRIENNLGELTGPDGPFDLRGRKFNTTLAEALLELQGAGTDADWTLWFWYDQAHSMEDPHRSYDFFVVDGRRNAIIRESVTFFDEVPGFSSNLTGFDPSIFHTLDKDAYMGWSNIQDFDQAKARYWYRRFYQETQIGQLMVLRADKPVLHFYPEGRVNIPALLSSIRFASWVIAAILALLAIHFIWR